jgi:hypothetical protein
MEPELSEVIKLDLHNTASLEPGVEYRQLDDGTLVVIYGGTARVVNVSIGRELDRSEWDVKL